MQREQNDKLIILSTARQGRRERTWLSNTVDSTNFRLHICNFYIFFKNSTLVALHLFRRPLRRSRHLQGTDHHPLISSICALAVLVRRLLEFLFLLPLLLGRDYRRRLLCCRRPPSCFTHSRTTNRLDGPLYVGSLPLPSNTRRATHSGGWLLFLPV